MRKIPLLHAILGSLITSFWFLISALFGYELSLCVGGGAFVTVVFSLIFWFLDGIILFRLAMWLFPLQQGAITSGTRQELIYDILYLPFTLFLIVPTTASKLTPPPVSRLLYKALGSRIGTNSYPSTATLFDPIFVHVGDSVIFGHNSTLVPHIFETGKPLSFHSIQVGNNVTLGVNAVVLAGTSIGDGAVIAAGAVVPKFTRIETGEVWGGIPARRLHPKN